MSTKKQKLTLSVSKEVVDKAKELGINISEITEEVLRRFAFAPKKAEKEQVYMKYEELFRTMLPLLRKYDAFVKIGSTELLDSKGNFLQLLDIFLNPDGTFQISDMESTFKDIRGVHLYDLLPPQGILSNFIVALKETADRRKEQVKELEMARRIIEAITQTTLIFGKNLKKNARER